MKRERKEQREELRVVYRCRSRGGQELEECFQSSSESSSDFRE
jgi:hypothetical protein